MNYWPGHFILGLLLSTGPLAALAPAPTTPAAPAVPYEASPSLRADALFPANLLTGVHYRVRGTVETQGGVNRFTIDSDEGDFTADGNEMLIERLREINAIDQLRHISKADESKFALKSAASAPLDLARGIVTQPRETVHGVAKGAWKLMNRAGVGIKGAVTDRFIQALLHPQNLTPKGSKVVLSGSVSPFLRQQLERRNIALVEKLSPVLAR